MKEAGLEELEKIVLGLGDLIDQVVFVGGITNLLLINPNLTSEMRITSDVDLIVNSSNSLEFHEFEQKLRARGFEDPSGKNLPICRLRFQGIDVDIMPSQPFSGMQTNKWYGEAVKNAEIRDLNGKPIKIINYIYFIASKIEAHADRGSKHNGRIDSKDLEDIILVTEARPSSKEELLKAQVHLKQYFQVEFKKLINDSSFEEFTYSCFQTNEQERAKQFLKMINELYK